MDGPRILSDKKAIEKYVDDVRRASDANRDALGFLPSSIFLEYARREKLLVAVDSVSLEYMGHILFDVRFPRATIIQMYCVEAHRRHGVARALLDALKKSLTKAGFMFIKAGVAQDLEFANNFWESQRFFVKDRKAGGVTTGRKILVRIHELDSPQLFPKSGLSISGSNSLGLRAVASASLPMYLVDLNVLFDLAHQRVRHDEAVSLFQSFYAGECRLAISDEIRRELQRTSKSGHPDAMLTLIGALPEIRLLRGKDSDLLEAELAKIVFPEKSMSSTFTANDLSDVKHLATAILSKLTGFITSDGRILDAASLIQLRHGIQICSPVDFLATSWAEVQTSEIDTTLHDRIELGPFKESGYDELRDLLLRCGLSTPEIVAGWLPVEKKGLSTTRMVIRTDNAIVGYVVLARVDPASKEIKVRAILDETFSQALSVAHLLLQKVTDTSTQSSIVKIVLELPERQVSLREVAFKMGFRATQISGFVAKVAVGHVVTQDSWPSFRNELLQATGIVLPDTAPEYEGHMQLIEIRCPDGERRYVRIDELEALLSPTLFCLKGRPAIVIPIQARFAAALLGHGKQLSLAPKMQVEAFGDRLYLGSPKVLKCYERGALAFFYESGKNGEHGIVAIARVVDSYLIRGDAVGEESLTKSILTIKTMRDIGKSADKAACLFDNIVVMRTPVGLSQLKKMGHGVMKLRTTNRITQEQVDCILREGMTGE